MSQFHEFIVDGFNLTDTDSFGCRWTVEAVDGWFTGGESRADSQPKAQQDGTWRGPTFHEGRVITLRGKVFCQSSTDMERAGRRLSALLALGEGELSGQSAAGNLSTVVRREDRPRFDPISYRHATWQVTAASESPLLFGPEVSGEATLAGVAGSGGLTWPLTWPLDWGVAPGVTPGAVFLPNDGTVAYSPRFRVDGPVPNPTVTMVATGDRIRFNGTVTDGQWLEIDTRSRRVLLNGQVSVRGQVDWSGDWLVPVGGTDIAWTADAADPDAKLSAYGWEGAYL